jgi:hypothetical protein
MARDDRIILDDDDARPHLVPFSLTCSGALEGRHGPIKPRSRVSHADTAGPDKGLHSHDPSDPPADDPSIAGPPTDLTVKPARLLGADFVRQQGRYRFAKAYRGDIWRSDAPAPLARTEVREGDYLLAINGRPGGRSR